MRKSKRRRSDARRRGSSSKNASSESSPPNSSYNSAPQPSILMSTPRNPGSDTSSQPASLESSPQNPMPPALPALPAPEVNPPTPQALLPVNAKSKASSAATLPGPLVHMGPSSCACVPCPGSSTCWRRLGQCHGRIFDALMPGDWHPLPGRGIPSLLTFYRRSGRKQAIHRNSRAPSSRDSCCSSGSPGNCLLHH